VLRSLPVTHYGGAVSLSILFKCPRSSYLRAGIAFLSLAAGVQSRLSQGASVPHVIELRTKDVRVDLQAGPAGPRLVRMIGKGARLWINLADEVLPTSVTVTGKDGQTASVSVAWQVKPALTVVNNHKVMFVYESAVPHLRLCWEWEARTSFGPVEHRITIENLGVEEVWLPMVDSLRMNLQVDPTKHLRNLYIEKGADSPSAEGTHLDTVAAGYEWTGKSSTYAHPEPGEAREIIPAEFVYSANASEGGWFAGLEFSGRTRISLQRQADSVKTVLGLDPEPGPFRTRLATGGSFATPTVFLGAFRGGADGAGNQLRPWVRTVLGNPQTWKDAQYPLLVNNSWGSGMQVDEPLAMKMIAESKELGLEMFHLDAGWFRGVGDWYPDAKKFPHGLAAIADEAHRLGLRFGLWVDWAQAGVDTDAGALNVRDLKVHNWMVTDVARGWKPEEFKGQTIDLGVPAAHEYAAGEVKRIVESYHLDMLEHDGYLVAQGCVRDDHPHAPPNRSTMTVTHDSGFDFVHADNSTDVSYHAVRAYYDIYEQTRRKHPGLLFEICNDGGRMVDFGSAAHGDYFSITDTYDPLSNRRAFFDASHVLPPAMLESYVEKWPTPKLENFLYMLRSGMMGWMTLMTDTTAWSPEQHEAARRAFALYKERLRPLIRDGELYHVSDRPDGVHWDGIEFMNAQHGEGVLYAFRGSGVEEATHRFVLAGLDAHQRYRLHFEDGGAADTEMTGN
jgi:hypothetical protein